MEKKKRRRRKGAAEAPSFQADHKWGTDAICLACTSAPSWPALARRIRESALSKEDAREGVIKTWKEFFGRVKAGCSAPEDLLEAMKFWREWPRLCWLYRPDTKAECSDSILDRLVWIGCARSRAEEFLKMAAEGMELDCSSIEISGHHSRTVITEHPELGEYGDWPECLNAVDKIDPPEAIQSIHKATELLIRLEIRLRAQMTIRPQLNEAELLSLRCLQEAGHSCPHQRIADSINRDRKTVSKGFRRLRDLGLIERARGKRGGDAITPAGRVFLDTIDKGRPPIDQKSSIA